MYNYKYCCIGSYYGKMFFLCLHTSIAKISAMTIKKWRLFFLILLIPGLTDAQDPQFSQFYSAPLTLPRAL